jgi:hypothetical protein
VTSKEEWLALAERCEKATGPDREVDVLIGLALDWKTEATRPLREVVAIYGGPAEFVARCIDSPVSIYSHDEHMPRWAGSLDAITAMIERELPGRHWLSGQAGDNWPGLFSCWIMPPPGPCDLDLICRAATEPLARCAAFCRAKAAGA